MAVADAEEDSYKRHLIGDEMPCIDLKLWYLLCVTNAVNDQNDVSGCSESQESCEL